MRGGRRSRCGGAALLLAMIMLTLVATIAAGMVWQQSRAVSVEAAERARAQAVWLLAPGIDFARDVARRLSDHRSVNDQPWDYRIDETKLSSLLAVDRENNADSALDATISGRIEDAQSRYNLNNLINDQGGIDPVEKRTLLRLCQLLGLDGLDETIATRMRLARGQTTADGSSADVPIAPARIEQLGWLGLDAATVARLSDYVDILPGRTPINVNTAKREVIYAVLEGIDAGTAAQVERQRDNRFEDVAQLKEKLPPDFKLDEGRVKLRSEYMYVTATLRYEDRALSERALLKVNGIGPSAEVKVLRQDFGPLKPST